MPRQISYYRSRIELAIVAPYGDEDDLIQFVVIPSAVGTIDTVITSLSNVQITVNEIAVTVPFNLRLNDEVSVTFTAATADGVFILQGNITAFEFEGDAVVGDVLVGKTFYSDSTEQKTGIMPDRGTVSTDITAKAQEVTITAGKHSGSGVVKISTTEQAKIIAANIKKDIEILGVTGTLEGSVWEEVEF